jgi:hypothetical protein
MIYNTELEKMTMRSDTLNDVSLKLKFCPQRVLHAGAIGFPDERMREASYASQNVDKWQHIFAVQILQYGMEVSLFLKSAHRHIF